MFDLNYPKLLEMFPEHLDPKRSESASFLIWYLQNYYRLDPVEATDAVCDQPNDKGIDGIFVNDNDKTITILQSKISQSSTSTIGDKSLREFAGSLTQLSTREAVENLVKTGNVLLSDLIKRLDLTNKIATHELRGEFVTNIDADQNGLDFLSTTPQINFIGKTTLVATYISDKRDLPIHRKIDFDVIGFKVSEYTADIDTRAAIAPIKATELVTMDGIANQSLFAYNVRGPLGKTGVNKEIRVSIKDQSLHKFFPLFHNGITVIAKELTVSNDAISIDDYFVVNGCQSLTALYDSRKFLTDDLRILIKFVKMEPSSPWAKTVTEYSNNQNAVRERDFMANDATQVRLQNEFAIHYEGEFWLEIKRGEVKQVGRKISNEDTGLLLMAFDSKEPWATHRKYQVFDEKYSDLFGRPEVTADRIVMLQMLSDAITAGLPNIENQLIAKYALTRYALVYVLRNVLEKDALFPTLTTKPEDFVRQVSDRQYFLEAISKITGDVIEGLNAEVEQYEETFDYRARVRDEKWVKELSKNVVRDHMILERRGKIPSFSEEWSAKP